MNLHTPERGAIESFDEYQDRRKQSHAANKLPGRVIFSPSRKAPHQTSDRAYRREAIAAAGGIRQYKRLKNGGWAKV